MVYSWTCGKEVIGRIDNDLSIDFADWIAKAPLWIADGLAQLNIRAAWKASSDVITIEGHTGMLPCNLKLLIAIDYNGERMNTTSKISSPFFERSSLFNSPHTYEVDTNGNFLTTFEDGEVTVLSMKAPVEYWQEHNIFMPQVPNNPFVLEALKWFVMFRILQKGTKHPIFNLRDQNPYTNPGIAWDMYSKKARNSVSTLTSDERENLSKFLRTFLNDINYHNSSSYPIQQRTPLNRTDFSGITSNP